MKIPLQGPSDTHQGKSRSRSADNFNEGNSATKVQAALLFDGNPATGPTNTVQRRKHLLQFATNSVLLQLYPIHIFTSQIYKYDKGWSYSGGASSQRRIIFAGVNLSQFL